MKEWFFVCVREYYSYRHQPHVPGKASYPVTLAAPRFRKTLSCAKRKMARCTELEVLTNEAPSACSPASP